MIPGTDINTIVHAIGALGIAGIIFAESGLLAGFFLPGDTLLFAAGFLAQQGVVGLNVHALIGLLFAAAVLGNATGYMIGKHAGRRLFKRPDSLFFSHQNLQRAEDFYKKYGALMLVLTRFMPVVRTFAPLVAGVANMNFTRFMLYNALGGGLWVASVTYLGYFGGAFLQAHGINVESFILPVVFGVMLIVLLSPVYHMAHDKGSREVFLNKFKGRGEKN